MILDTRTSLKRVCKLINLNEYEESVNIERWCKRVQNANNQHFVEAMTSRPYSTNDHTKRVGRWKENLTKEEIEIVVPMVKETALKFGYVL